MEPRRSPRNGYVLLSAAHNEERLLAQTIEAVASQTVPPLRWVIASDRSTDRTDAIIQEHARRHPFLRYLRIDQNQGRGVIAKVNALRLAYEQMRDCDHAFVGNLDADISFAPTYYEQLMHRFEEDRLLGIAGGMIYERHGAEFRGRVSNSVTSVAHAAQLLRVSCYEDIGGYVALKYGGEDWYAEIRARMHGWKVQSFEDIHVMHHRPTGAADFVLRHRFREGKMDYSVGSHPAFEVFKCVRRIPETPFALGAATRLSGFCWSYLKREPRLISAASVNFLRREQLRKIRGMFARQAESSRLSFEN